VQKSERQKKPTDQISQKDKQKKQKKLAYTTQQQQQSPSTGIRV
jgi:hypothetical protein